MFFKDIFKIILISDTEYDPSGNSNSSVHVGTGILNLNIFVLNFYIFPCIVNAKFDKATYLSFLFQFISSKRLSNSL